VAVRDEGDWDGALPEQVVERLPVGFAGNVRVLGGGQQKAGTLCHTQSPVTRQLPQSARIT